MNGFSKEREIYRQRGIEFTDGEWEGFLKEADETGILLAKELDLVYDKETKTFSEPQT